MIRPLVESIVDAAAIADVVVQLSLHRWLEAYEMAVKAVRREGAWVAWLY